MIKQQRAVVVVDAEGFIQQTRRRKPRNRHRPSGTPLALGPGDDIAFSSLELSIYAILKAAFLRKQQLTPEEILQEVNKGTVDVREEYTIRQVWDALDNEEALGKYAYRMVKNYWTLRTH